MPAEDAAGLSAQGRTEKVVTDPTGPAHISGIELLSGEVNEAVQCACVGIDGLGQQRGIESCVVQSAKDQRNAGDVANFARVSSLPKESQSPKKVLGNCETVGLHHLAIRLVYAMAVNRPSAARPKVHPISGARQNHVAVGCWGPPLVLLSAVATLVAL